jgi:hypothetical protein
VAVRQKRGRAEYKWPGQPRVSPSKVLAYNIIDKATLTIWIIQMKLLDKIGKRYIGYEYSK